MYNMPTLHIRLVPNALGGKNKVFLSNPIRSQNLHLKSATVLKPNTSYTGGSIKINLPFLGANQFHTNDRKGYLSIPINTDSKYTSHTFGSGLRLDADHIDAIFTAVLCDQDGAPITATTNMTEVNLFLDYETHSLF